MVDILLANVWVSTTSQICGIRVVQSQWKNSCHWVIFFSIKINFLFKWYFDRASVLVWIITVYIAQRTSKVNQFNWIAHIKYHLTLLHIFYSIQSNYFIYSTHVAFIFHTTTIGYRFCARCWCHWWRHRQLRRTDRSWWRRRCRENWSNEIQW